MRQNRKTESLGCTHTNSTMSWRWRFCGACGNQRNSCCCCWCSWWGCHIRSSSEKRWLILCGRKQKISITELACQHFTTPICASLPREGCLGLGSRADLPSFGAHLLEARRGGDCARAPNLFASAVALAQSSLLGLLHWVNVSAASAAAHSPKRVVQCSSGSVVAMTSAKVCICLPCLVSNEKGKIIIKSPAIHCWRSCQRRPQLGVGSPDASDGCRRVESIADWRLWRCLEDQRINWKWRVCRWYANWNHWD